ncbi:MAG: hypothetical protein D6696_04595 [Acidobacteria bacterium]|nr:MAG: hypothetical protein D6696_04595 [Acidobacteriota bacterium]
MLDSLASMMLDLLKSIGVGRLIAFVLILFVIVQISRRLSILGDHERLAVFHDGRFLKFRGPGLVFSILGPKQEITERMSLGAVGTLVSDDVGRFGSVHVPVEHEEDLALGSNIQITKFDEQAAIVEESSKSAVRRCPKCGHEFV